MASDCTSSDICTDEENVPPSLYSMSTWPSAKVLTKSTKYLSGRQRVIDCGHEVSKIRRAGSLGFSTCACAAVGKAKAKPNAAVAIAPLTARASGVFLLFKPCSSKQVRACK